MRLFQLLFSYVFDMKERLHNILEVCGLIRQLNLQSVTDSALKSSVCLVIFSQMSYAIKETRLSKRK